MTKVFKRWMIPEGYCWKSVHRLIIKTNTGATLEDGMTRFPRISFERRTTKLAGIRYTALMHKLKKKRVQPVYVIDEAWRRYLEYLGERGLPCQSSQATANRNTEVEGPGPGPSKHDGGSVSFVTTQERLDRLRRRCRELTCATPDQSVDDEAVYLNVAGECPKGRVYGLGSLGRKKRRYADPGASTSEMPDMVPRAEFNVVAEQLRKVMEFMQSKDLGMNMDGAGLSQQQPPPPPAPPPHDQQQLSQIDPVDPPQQGDNVERETGLTVRPIIPILMTKKLLKLVVVVFPGEDSRMLLKFVSLFFKIVTQNLAVGRVETMSFSWITMYSLCRFHLHTLERICSRRYLALSWFGIARKEPREYALSPVVVLEMENHKIRDGYKNSVSKSETESETDNSVSDDSVSDSVSKSKWNRDG
ncbi:hypothetical protein Sjap_008746 [Stephania japonica]|uniref:Transposase n=1 Tax=Stephania japonica TaxID=461633 RepID=A0AAP0JSI3_9MAGN